MTDIPTLLRPIDGAHPCGQSLEYDPAHALLMARMVPRAAAQYGSFVDAAGTPDWSVIARDCEALLRRSRDIPLLVGLCRARLALSQAPGLAQALGLLRAVIERWPDDVHPQLVIDGQPEPAMRANALAALVDPDGLLGEIGDLVVVATTTMRLNVRDIARAMPPTGNRSQTSAPTRWPAAESGEAMLPRLQAAIADARTGAAFQVAALRQACDHARAIDAWSRDGLDECAPSLQRLLNLLAPFESLGSGAPPAVASAEVPETGEQKTPSTVRKNRADAEPLKLHASHGAAPSVSVEPMAVHAARHDAAAAIGSARRWFETHEPSSPVAVLLKQAERMVGQRFVQVADAIPIELMRQWDAHVDTAGSEASSSAVSAGESDR